MSASWSDPHMDRFERDAQREHEIELAEINYQPTLAEVVGDAVKTVAVCAAAVAILWLLLAYGVIHG